jgi:ABC-2 type transport system permease protein
MHLRSILAIARKDALDIIVNKSTLFSLLSIIFVAVLFLLISSLLGTKDTKLLIYDPGNSGIEKVINSEYAHLVVTHASSLEEVSTAFGPDGASKSSQYAIGVVVPENFLGSLHSGNRPQLSLYINGDQISNLDSQLTVRLITSYASSVANPQPVALSMATINPPHTTPIGDISGLYQATGLLMTFLTGIGLVSNLLIEEKEKKTLRMLMVSPATFLDVVLAKLLVGLTYQLALSGIVLAIVKGFTGEIPLVLLFVLLGATFSLTLGLLAGCIFQTTAASGGFIGAISMFFIAPTIFIGPLAFLIQNTPIEYIVKLLPTYYIAHGTYNAVQSQSTFASVSLDAGVLIACIGILLIASAWALRRQAAVVATI